MNNINAFLSKNFHLIALVLLGLIFFNTCGNPNRVTNKRLETLAQEIDSLEATTVTVEDLMIEGLRSEKRMIQSTDRKILDVNRQSEIDKEIQRLLSK
jgi:hypothetical protein